MTGGLMMDLLLDLVKVDPINKKKEKMNRKGYNSLPIKINDYVSFCSCNDYYSAV